MLSIVTKQKCQTYKIWKGGENTNSNNMTGGFSNSVQEVAWSKKNTQNNNKANKKEDGAQPWMRAVL